MARSGFKMKSSPTKGNLGDFFSSLGKQLRSNKKGVDEVYAEKKSRKPGESKFQADVRRRQEANKAKRASNKADAEYYGSAEDKAKNSEANRIKPTVTEEHKSKSTKSTKPDWSKAPKVGTQARTDWYKKFNLALDDTTPLTKKSPYKKGLGKYTKKAKGSRGFKMKK